MPPKRDRWVTECRNLWDHLCGLYYAGRLPSPTRTRVLPEIPANKRKGETVIWATFDWHRNGHTTLTVSQKAIEVGDSAFLRACILHEMIHAHTGSVSHESEEWRAEVRRLSDLGALAWVI